MGKYDNLGGHILTTKHISSVDPNDKGEISQAYEAFKELRRSKDPKPLKANDLVLTKVNIEYTGFFLKNELSFTFS